jgi:hypothetical protein
VWRHDGAIISEYALVLGGLVISIKGKYARWRIWPKRKKVVENEVYGSDHTSFMYSYMELDG